MRLAIDASRTTLARITGTEHYARSLIRALIQHNPGHDIALYFRDAPAPGLFPDSSRVTIHVIPQRRLWTHTRFAATLWSSRPDVTFVPAHTLPFVFPGRAAVTVHDLGFRYFPDAHPRLTRWYLDLTTRTSAARASIILADSQATARDLTHFYGTPAAKIRVVYPGVDAPYINDTATIRAKYNLPDRYFLFIGTLQPRKNIARLVEAFQRAELPGVSLVLAGGKGWLYDEAWTAGVPNVHLIGYVDDADKGALYKESLGLVFPSLYEGFGFPVIEAMHGGTPVICSSTSSLPELAGDAALLVDPLNVEAIAVAMRQLAEAPALRDRLRERGPAQAARFTWESAAQTTWAALEAAANA